MSRLGESEGNSYSRTWELNVYELNREPHELIDDDTEIAVSPKVLQNELMCPICLDILKVTMTTKECLHRFCQECIITALRAGNKECPTCRKKLVSKRSLRPDPNFDGIISKIYPNREEYDALQAQALEKLNRKRLTAAATASNSGGRTNGRSRSHNANAASSSSAAALANEHNNETVSSSSSFNHPRGSENRSHRRVAYVSDESEDEESRASTEQSSLHMQQEHDELEIILKPHPILETNLVSRRFLKTTSNATVNHLLRYLWTRLCLEGSSMVGAGGASNGGNGTDEEITTQFQLYISNSEKHPQPASFQLLNSSFSLEQISDKYWRQNQPIELFYHHIAPKGDKHADHHSENGSMVSSANS